MNDRNYDSSRIEEILFDGIPKKGVGIKFRERKLPQLVRYFVKEIDVEQASKDLKIDIRYTRRFYANLRKLKDGLGREKEINAKNKDVRSQSSKIRRQSLD